MIFLIFMAAMTATVTTGLLPKDKQILRETILIRQADPIATSLPKKQIVKSKQKKKLVCKVWGTK